MTETNKFIDVRHLKQYFPIKGGVFQSTVGYVKAVDDISFTINKGEVMGLQWKDVDFEEGVSLDVVNQQLVEQCLS